MADCQCTFLSKPKAFKWNYINKALKMDQYTGTHVSVHNRKIYGLQRHLVVVTPQ